MLQWPDGFLLSKQLTTLFWKLYYTYRALASDALAYLWDKSVGLIWNACSSSQSLTNTVSHPGPQALLQHRVMESHIRSKGTRNNFSLCSVTCTYCLQCKCATMGRINCTGHSASEKGHKDFLDPSFTTFCHTTPEWALGMVGLEIKIFIHPLAAIWGRTSAEQARRPTTVARVREEP